MSEFLTVSEHFYSIQGEGRTVGKPAVFLRLTGCDYECVWCDTTEVWKKGVRKSVVDWAKLIDKCYHEQLTSHRCSLVLTGGNPLLQQKALLVLLRILKYDYGLDPYVEIETQGSIAPADGWLSYAHQWNVSPKLANAGVSFNADLRNAVLLRLNARHLLGEIITFKFPVNSPLDMNDVNEIVRKLGLDPSSVWLMPVCSSRLDFTAISPAVADWSLKSGFNFSPRLQLSIWDRKTGV